MEMFLTINIYIFRYQIYKARDGSFIYLEIVIEFPREKPINCCDGGRGDSQQPHHHFHYENQLIETETSD